MAHNIQTIIDIQTLFKLVVDGPPLKRKNPKPIGGPLANLSRQWQRGNIDRNVLCRKLFYYYETKFGRGYKQGLHTLVAYRCITGDYQFGTVSK